MPDSSNPILASVVIPAKDEAENLVFVLDEVATALSGELYEIIVVDDGSTDNTAEVLNGKKASGIPVRHLRHAQSLGQSVALRSGLLVAGGEIIVTMDGDGQNDPANIPRMLATLAEAGTGVGAVAGQRRGRTDGGRKKLASRLANGLRRWVLDDGIADSGCGLRAVRREIFLRLPFFDGWHRFLPALVLREGFAVATIDIVDRPRRHGLSHYGIVGRGARGLLDLCGVWWLRRRSGGLAASARQLPTNTILADESPDVAAASSTATTRRYPASASGPS